ncbi:GTP pyrophosphokinase [Chitinimonas arctica]|nr:RelA/SpoT domain-containing protein [Chitinimonas arctica]
MNHLAARVRTLIRSCASIGNNASCSEDIGGPSLDIGRSQSIVVKSKLINATEDSVPSSDFSQEKINFNSYYEKNLGILKEARNSFIALITALLRQKPDIRISKVEGRIKEEGECIAKFSEKYLPDLERNNIDYEIRDHITDLVGLRIVCLDDEDVEKISALVQEHFDKARQVEDAAPENGDVLEYKGIHLDLKLNDRRSDLFEYQSCKDVGFELQIRSIAQDSWSVLHPKIKLRNLLPFH